MTDLFTPPAPQPPAPARPNVPEFSVSELAFSLKKTLEDTYGRIRVRGELSRVKIHSSGHLYSDLKDTDAVLNIVCWKGTLQRLNLRPEEGLEVICTGRISSYPARSNYQMVVDHIELAGEGALLKMLEDRRKKLAAEGLFDADRKKALPFIPQVIGVVTSPTGAVIRDILHRLDDRFPRPVLIWPVAVQGPDAAAQIARAIRGFDSLPAGGAVARPDVIIVARGGGSLEDLMAFNDEAVVRAVSECSIPVISAVGHETDTTLIDYAADVRAPTPTAAAEMVVPRRDELIATVGDAGLRQRRALTRLMTEARRFVEATAARLPDPARIFDMAQQRIDHAADRLTHAFERGLSRRAAGATDAGARLRHPRQIIAEAGRILTLRTEHLRRVGLTMTDMPEKNLRHAGAMLEVLSFERILERGFAVIRGADDTIITAAADLKAGTDVAVQMRDGRKNMRVNS